MSGVDPWGLSTVAGAESSSQSAFLYNYGNDDLSIDELISGTIDLSGVDPSDAMIFNFKYAYRKRNTENDEWLRFFISKDCGETWALRKVIHGGDLSSVTATSSYTPQPGAEWYSVDVTNINSEYYVSNFRYKFQFENDNGNNIYLDNINLYPSSMTSLVEQNQEIGLSLYPNPAKEKTDLVVFGLSGENFKIGLYSALGQEISLLYNGDIIKGTNKFEINTAALTEGFYLVKIENEDYQETIKLIKR